MGTRGCVAVGTLDKWEGVYNHWDSYPSGLGKEVWDEAQRVGGEKLAAELLRFGDWREYKHGGVCEYCGKNAGQPHSISGEIFAWKGDGYPDPQAEKHEHSESEPRIRSGNADPLFIEWVYILEGKKMHILAHDGISHNEEEVEQKREECKNKANVKTYGHCTYWHKHVATIALDGLEPEWKKLEEDEGE